MKTLILGASGATGKYLVEQLLEKGHKVKAMVRSEKRVPEKWKSYEGLTLIEAGISTVSTEKMQEYIRDCDAIASCLGII